MQTTPATRRRNETSLPRCLFRWVTKMTDLRIVWFKGSVTVLAVEVKGNNFGIVKTGPVG
jgi:hypothetical protein